MASLENEWRVEDESCPNRPWLSGLEREGMAGQSLPSRCQIPGISAPLLPPVQLHRTQYNSLPCAGSRHHPEVARERADRLQVQPEVPSEHLPRKTSDSAHGRMQRIRRANDGA